MTGSGRKVGTAFPDAVKLACRSWLKRHSSDTVERVAKFILSTNSTKYVGLEMIETVKNRYAPEFTAKGLDLDSLMSSKKPYV